MRKLLLVLALVTTVAVTACGDSSDAVTTGGPDSGTGVIAVQLEELDGAFVEGFEVGLRFETLDGEVIGSTLWSDFVASMPDASLDAFYDSVLEQEVPAGTVVVLASANVGIGPPPEIPDLDGPLRCRLEVEVPQDGRVDVEVTFDDPDACLRLR